MTDYRILMGFREGEQIVYDGDLCDVTDVRTDDSGGIQITMQRRSVRPRRYVDPHMGRGE